MKFKKIFALFLGVLMMTSCSSTSTGSGSARQSVLFELKLDQANPSEAQVEIFVPGAVQTFRAPTDYGGAPVFTKFLKDVKATDAGGNNLPVELNGPTVTVKTNGLENYSLRYTYLIPQKISGEVDQSLPNLNSSYGRFDNNTLFLLPEGTSQMPGELRISPPKGWRVATSWGDGTEFRIPQISDVVSGMIAMGDFQFSSAAVGDVQVSFAIKGEYSTALIKEQFAKVFKAQQEIAGPLPTKKFLVVLQPTVNGCCKGTSLADSLIVNVPPKESLKPLNFPLVGTISHELFHQWNARLVMPASEEGAYLFTEGFTNYFAVAALVKAKLVPPESFAWFLWHYRNLLEKNPKHKEVDFQKIQAGYKAGDPELIDLAYTRGPFVAVLLDLALREDSGGRASLPIWFQKLTERFGRQKGYTIPDLRQLVVEVSSRPNGKAVTIFDDFFIGNKPINTTELFKDLGISCVEATKKCTLAKILDQPTRTKLFSATP